MFRRKRKDKGVCFYKEACGGMESIMEDLEFLINEKMQEINKIMDRLVYNIESYKFLRDRVERHIEKNQSEAVKDLNCFSDEINKLITESTDNFLSTKVFIKEYGLYYLNEKDLHKKLAYEKKYNEFEKKHNENVIIIEALVERNGFIQKEGDLVDQKIK